MKENFLLSGKVLTATRFISKLIKIRLSLVHDVCRVLKAAG